MTIGANMSCQLIHVKYQRSKHITFFKNLSF